MKKILFYLLIISMSSKLFCSEDVYVRYYAKLFRKADKSSQLLSILDDSCKLRLISEDGEWIEVQAKGFRGWMERSSTNLKELPQEPVESREATSVFPYYLGAAGAIALILFVLFLLRPKKRGVRSDLTGSTEVIDHQNRSKFNVLIFATNDFAVNTTQSGTKRLSTCFREIGFAVHFFESLKMGRIILNFKVSMIAVDYSIHKRTVSQLELLLKLWGVSSSIPVFFYNVPDPQKVSGGKFLRNVNFLGEDVNDSDILRLVAPVVEKAERKNPGILHGTITGEGVSEILQLIELGNKNGLLTFSNEEEQKVGILGFNKGRVLFARSLKSEGREAASELCRLKNGSFAFTNESINKSNCSFNITELLFQIAQIDDELLQKNIQKRGLHDIVQNSVHAS